MTLTPLMTRNGLIHLESLPETALTAAALGETLAKNNRYVGRTAEPWSVAAHSVLVSRLCPHKKEQAWGLLHDAHEAFIGDIITPAVTFIANQSRPVAGTIVERCVRSAKADLDRQICAAWGIDPAMVDLEEVGQYDRIALEAEMFFFFDAIPDGWCRDHDRALNHLRGLPVTGNWQAGMMLWVSEAERLAHLGACRRPTPQTNQAA
jgi:hypothetical protein